MARYLEFKVWLKDIEPPIWRRFLLAEKQTFAQLHEAIQDSFGWGYEHLWEFRDKGGRKTIAGCAMEGAFAGEEAPPADELPLVQHFARAKTRCLYVYDFGDNWEHVVELAKVVELPEKFKRRLLDGARACPPEDCGGVYGYYECMEAAKLTESQAAKSSNGDAADRKEWLGDWQPEEFSLAAAKKRFDR